MKIQNVGLIIAVEIQAFFRKFGSPEKEEISGYTVYRLQIGDKRIFAVQSMAGEIYAAGATQFLISVCHADIIVNYGIVGGLTEKSGTLSTCFVEKVVHYSFDTSEIDGCEVGRYLNYPSVFLPVRKDVLDVCKRIAPNVPLVVCASGDKFVSSSEEKSSIAERFHADICEMEAAAILLIADKNGVPCLLVKTVADSLFGGTEEYAVSREKASDTCLAFLENFLKEM